MPLKSKIKNLQVSVDKAIIINNWQRKGRPKPPPDEYKQYIVKYYRTILKYKYFVETGTYLGNMIEAQRNNFEYLFSIELSYALWKNALQRFLLHKHICILHGDSSKLLEKVIAALDGPAIFWLDAHYSGGFTARGSNDCPILEELAIILKQKKYNHLILIDDARLFREAHNFPNIDTVMRHIKSLNPSYKCFILDDIIRCYI